jgi:tryptophanase
MQHIPVHEYPGQSLVCALYVEGGIRACEIGSLMFGKYDAQGKLIPAQMELVRLAIPRRVYTQSHIDYVAEVIIEVYQNRAGIKGMKITEEAKLLRHFTAKLEEVG